MMKRVCIRPVTAAAFALALTVMLGACENPQSEDGAGYNDADGDDGSGNSSSPAVSSAHRPATRAPAIGCPSRGRTVRSAASLRRALAGASPGDVIRLADGAYGGGFVIERSGTRRRPIYLCGSRRAILDGLDDTDYVLHLNGAAWWRIVGFSVRNGQKGVVADRARHNVLSGMWVGRIGDEAIHLRTFSTDNRVVGNTVRDTGHRNANFGEGIYVGSAHSNWCRYTNCKIDRSDRNAVIDNDIADTTSENIDIKEGTVDGVIARNRLSGEGMTEADSWIDVKGSGWLVENNVGHQSPEDGIQTHVEYEGWGSRNVFRGNRLYVNGPGYGIYIHEEERSRNTVRCDNLVRGADSGKSNIPCRGPATDRPARSG